MSDYFYFLEFLIIKHVFRGQYGVNTMGLALQTMRKLFAKENQ